MNIPKAIADRIAELEDAVTKAADRARLCQEELKILEFAVKAYTEEDPAVDIEDIPLTVDTVRVRPRIRLRKIAPPIPAPPQSGFDYDAVAAVLREAPEDGLPSSALPIDHQSRLAVLKKRGVARKLPSGNWALA